MGMVNIKTPADTFCQQFFTNLFVIYWAAEMTKRLVKNCWQNVSAGVLKLTIPIIIHSKNLSIYQSI